MFFRRDIAQHGRAHPTDHARADGRGDVVVAWRNVYRQRAQGVERRFVAMLKLQVHILLDHVHRHMARAFDHGLHIVLPSDFGQLAQRFQFGKLGFVVGIAGATWAQAIA